MGCAALWGVISFFLCLVLFVFVIGEPILFLLKLAPEVEFGYYSRLAFTMLKEL